LLGPSGGGKTTILRMISGLEQPDSGSILLDNTDVTRLSPRQRNVGMVFQDYGLYPSMDVYGNIAYGLENRHMPKPEIQKRVAEAAEKLKLTTLLRRGITELSGGEQQRVALARILAKDADIFLYDEPLANLDPKLRYQARRDIVAVHRARQVPSIYVTHDQGEAFAIGDRIAVIAHGRLQQVGTPAELLEKPANLFMARFIGSPPMNILPGKIQVQDAQMVVQVNDITFPLSEQWQQIIEQKNTSELLLGIAPQAIIPPWQIAEEENLSLLNVEVSDLEPLIGEVVAYLKLTPELTLASLWPEPETLPEIGDQLSVGFAPQAFRLFDAATEEALEGDCQES
ncbi:MAG TPA: ABC transporter ATP-binding protein, partial [Ktedonobacteraceae bacterium]|nr:ABC transporter ATP-binding protein [Ktedonobacteraceae bacterium]